MFRNASRKVLLGMCVASLVLTGALVRPTAWAQDSKKAAKKGTAAAKSDTTGQRLPAYYAKVVDDTQRDKIYAIQKAHAAKIESLQAELKAAMEKRDAEIEAVLTPKQLQQVKAMAAEAKAKRASASADGSKSADSAEAKPAAKATIRSPSGKAAKKAG